MAKTKTKASGKQKTTSKSKAKGKAEHIDDWERKRNIKADSVLSQSEIDNLLLAITGTSDDEETVSPTDMRKIKTYDFKRPDIFTKEQIRRISIIFENVCKELTTYFSARLKRLVHVHLASTDQLTYEEFIRSCPTPTTLCPALWEGQKAVVEIDPSITTEFLRSINREMDKYNYERLESDLNTELDDLNLDEETKADVISTVQNVISAPRYINRDLTEKEALLMQSFILSPIYKHITESFNLYQTKDEWGGTRKDKEKLVPLAEPEEMHIECNSHFAQIANPSDMGLFLTIEMKLNDEYGMCNIFLPKEFVSEVLIKKEIIMVKTSKANKYGLDVVPGNSGVSLGQFNMPEGEKLETGTIIELDKLAGEPVDLFDKKTGKVFARGEVVVIDESFGVRVTEVVDESK